MPFLSIQSNTAIHGANNPNSAADKTLQQTSVPTQTWFVVPAADTLCGTDPMCADKTAKGTMTSTLFGTVSPRVNNRQDFNPF